MFEVGINSVIRLVLVLLLAPGFAGASEGLAELYNRGNAVYRQGNFEGAVALYEQVIAQGVQNSDLYYNLGNAYYKNGQLGRAILSYERALKLAPDDEDVQANLAFVNAQKVDRETDVDANVLTRVLQAFFNFFSANVLTWMCSVCLVGLAGAGIGWLFVPMRRLVWIGAVVVLGLGLVGSGSLLAFKIYQRGISEAIVLANEAVGRSGPGDDFLQVFTLHEGTKVTVERREGNWLLIRLSSGIGGWLPARTLERI